MAQSGGWLARVARRFGEMMSGASEVDADNWNMFSQETAASVREAGPTHAERSSPLPQGVTLGENGRYLSKGYSFSTLQQAAAHAKMTATPPVAFASPGRSSSTFASRLSKASASWVGESTRVDVGGRTANLEMVYYGTPNSYDPKHDKSRIDPSLAVDPRGDPSGSTLSYWQSYEGFDPRARWTYLDWLEGGRKDPNIPIGYVFVFFYGLEQRLIVDDARDDVSAIFAEVRRLISIYGDQYSFQGYASRLLALATIYEPPEFTPPTVASTQSYDVELPLDVRIRLGRRLADDQPFDADDALCWVLALPDVYLRTPGQRCFDELLEIWRVRFLKRNPDGLRVRRPKAKIRYEYRAASGAFNSTITADLPDISGTSAPLTGLRTILDGCMEDLSSYSRFLGRDPYARGRLRGDLLLPLELRRGRESLVTCKTALDAFAIDVPPTALELARALDLEVEPEATKLSAVLVRQIGLALDSLDIGFEPDRRYGPAAALRCDARIALFPASLGGAVDPDSSAYSAARGMVEIAMLAAISDGVVAPSELEAIERRLRATADLQEHEIIRLLACARALAADPPKVRAALKKLADVAPERRAALAATAVEAVLADGRVLPEEVRFLEALHAALSLPASALYTALHRSGEDVGPVEVVAASSERTVPLPDEPPPGGVSIDAARLERIRGETMQVSAMLAAIFVEEEGADLAPTPIPKIAAGATAFGGLDEPHSALLLRLIAGAMPRTKFDAVAVELRLMPDGAIETLNEWGFDNFGESIIDDDDCVRISPDMIDQIEPMGVAA